MCDSLELAVIIQYSLELLARHTILNPSYDYRLRVTFSKKQTGWRLLRKADVARPITLLILQIMNS